MLRTRMLTLLLPVLALATACGEDDPTKPTPPPTHYDITVKMSSISAVEDCDATSEGDFQWRLVVRKSDEFGGMLQVDDTGIRTATITDGERQGIVTDPVLFRVPNSADAQFQVEYWIGEYDGSAADFTRHSWQNHKLDTGRGQMWASGSSFQEDRYYENADGSGNGLLKFAVWNDYAGCNGAAYYYVTWTPVWE